MMKKLLTPRLLVLIGAMLVISIGAFGQEPNQRPQDGRYAGPDGPADERPKLFEALGLTTEQIQAIRRLNQERKPVEAAARRRFQDAGRALNQAIYGDVVDNNEFQARLTEFQASQAEMARIKFSNELAVRQLLTPAQLEKFRELRRRFAENRSRMQGEGVRPQRRPGLRRMRRNIPPGN